MPRDLVTSRSLVASRSLHTTKLLIRPITITLNSGDKNGAGKATVTSEVNIDDLFDGGAWVRFWVQARSEGGSNNGNLINVGDVWKIYFENDNFIRFSYAFSGGVGAWKSNINVMKMRMREILVWYDNGDVTNVPVFFQNEVAASITSSTAPIGTRTTTVGQDNIFGNNPAGDRSADSWLTEFTYAKKTVAPTLAEKQNMFWSDVMPAGSDLKGRWRTEGGGLLLEDFNGNDAAISGGATLETGILPLFARDLVS